MATPNYGYEKRQRELAKKRKLEEKRMRKQNGKAEEPVNDTQSGETAHIEPGTPAADSTPAS